MCIRDSSTTGGQPTCGNSQCAELTEKMQTRFLEGISTEELEKLNEDECQICQKERKARWVVAEDTEDPRFKKEPFCTAPYIHQLNEPKHAANLERAINWAGVNKRSINWVTAHDYPLHRDDQARRFFLY